jgi:hypothetical protein
MKLATIVAAVALATGSAAFAADHSYSSNNDTSRHAAAAEHNDSSASHEGLLAKTKRALHRMGEKMRGAGHRTETAAGKDRDQDRSAMGNRSDTRSMGAAGESHDSARQRRMDEAYSHSSDKHSNDKR